MASTGQKRGLGRSRPSPHLDRESQPRTADNTFCCLSRLVRGTLAAELLTQSQTVFSPGLKSCECSPRPRGDRGCSRACRHEGTQSDTRRRLAPRCTCAVIPSEPGRPCTGALKHLYPGRHCLQPTLGQTTCWPPRSPEAWPINLGGKPQLLSCA